MQTSCTPYHFFCDLAANHAIRQRESSLSDHAAGLWRTSGKTLAANAFSRLDARFRPRTSFLSAADSSTNARPARMLLGNGMS